MLTWLHNARRKDVERYADELADYALRKGWQSRRWKPETVCVGKPQPGVYSVEELQRRDIVGLYAERQK